MERGRGGNKKRESAGFFAKNLVVFGSNTVGGKDSRLMGSIDGSEDG